MEPVAARSRGRSKKKAGSGFRLYVFRLDHPSLEPFGPTILSIVRMAFTGGLQVLASDGRSLESIKVDVGARSRFLRGCHRGFDKAQQRIGSLVIELHQKIETLAADLVRANREKEPSRTEMRARLIVLRNRQLALRRAADALLFNVIGFETWILRRLTLDHRIPAIDPVVLRRTLDVATRRNTDSRLRFSLVSDLTTVVQIGDLVEVSFDPVDPRWRLVELKEGRINALLSGLLGQNSSEADAKALDDEIAATVGRNAVEQAGRMRRQRKRRAEVERIAATDKGRDPATNMPMVVTPERVYTEFYVQAIQQVAEGAEKDGVAGASLDGGLYLVGMRRDQIRGDYIGAVNHVLLHLRQPERHCELIAGSDAAMAEFREVQKGQPFVDLVAHSMHAQWGIPVFFWMEPEKVIDLLLGDIRIFAQFDVERFFDFAAQRGVQVTWITGKEAEKLKKLKVSQRIPGSPGAWGIRAVTPDGSTQTFFSGFVARVIADLTTPRQLLDLIVRGPEQAERMGVTLK